MEQVKEATSSFNLTIGEARDLMQDMKVTIARAVQSFADKTGLFVYLQGGPDDGFKKHVINVTVQMPGAKG